MTTQDQSRAEFEAAWMKKPGVTKPPARFSNGGDYVYPAANTAWWAWQAARALPAGIEPVGWVDDGAIVFWEDLPPADGSDLFTAAQVRAMGRVPPGWQAVPVEPTEGMVVVGYKAQGMRTAYSAMLAAAPQPPAAPEVPSGVLEAIRAAGMQLLKGVDGFKLEKEMTASASSPSLPTLDAGNKPSGSRAVLRALLRPGSRS